MFFAGPFRILGIGQAKQERKERRSRKDCRRCVFGRILVFAILVFMMTGKDTLQQLPPTSPGLICGLWSPPNKSPGGTRN